MASQLGAARDGAHVASLWSDHTDPGMRSSSMQTAPEVSSWIRFLLQCCMGFPCTNHHSSGAEVPLFSRRVRGVVVLLTSCCGGIVSESPINSSGFPRIADAAGRAWRVGAFCLFFIFLISEVFTVWHWLPGGAPRYLVLISRQSKDFQGLRSLNPSLNSCASEDTV